MQLLDTFLNTQGFMPHGHCYLWTPMLLWTNVVADSLIGLAYLTIPFTLAYFVHRRRDIPFNWMFLAFGTFILACGATHIMDIWTTWNPQYGLSASIKLLTALASVPTAILLVRLLPRALLIPSQEQLARVNADLRNQIKERIGAEQALRESEARFRALTELSSDWYWEQDVDLRFTYFSEGAYRAVGERLTGFIGKRRWECPYIDAPEGGWESHQADVAARRPFQDLVIKRPDADGNVHWLSVSGAPIFDESGRFTGYSGIGRDITARVLASQALSESETRFRTLTHLSADWYWEQDEHLCFSFLSETAYQYPWVGASGVIGKTRWEIADVRPPEGGWDEHRAQVMRREPFRDLVLKRVMDDGTVHTISVSGAPTFDGAGRFRGYRGVTRNITAQVRASEALRESEARFRALTAVSSDWYWEQDEEFRFTLISDNAYRIMKLPLASSLGSRRWDMQSREIVGQGWEDHKRTLVEHRPFQNLVLRQRDGEGEMHVISISGAPIFLDDGTFRGYRGTSRDITERTAVEQALIESERRVRLATEYANIGIWEWSLEAQIIRWSGNIAPMLGLPPRSSVTPDEFVAFVHPDDVQRFLAVRSAWTSGTHPFELEHRIVRPDGAVRWVHQRGTLDRGDAGRPLRSLGVIQDITERKDAESIFRESEEKFRLLAENMRDVFWIYNPGRNSWDYVAPSCEQVWGLSRDALYAEPDSYEALILPEDLPIVHAAQKRQRSEQGEVEFRIRRPDGQRRWLLVRFSPPMMSSRGEKLVCGITEDITERKIEEERRAEEALRQRDALVREVHHRVKNTLQGVVGLLRRHERRAHLAAYSLDMAITQVQSVAIVHGLQGKRNSGGVVLHEMIDAMTQMHEGLSGRRVKLEQTHNPATRIVLAEATAAAVALVLNEVISNAVKHSAPERADAVVIRIDCGADRAQVCVRNRGRMPEGLDAARGEELGTGLKLVRALTPRDGMRIAFAQDGEMVEVHVDITPPVVVSFHAQAELGRQ